jgi:hypothetical protein
MGWRWLRGRMAGFWAVCRVGRGTARRAGWVSAGLVIVSCGLAVWLAESSGQAWQGVLVAVLISMPGLYLTWRTVPAGAREPVLAALAGRRAAQWMGYQLGVHEVVGGGPPPPYVSRPHDDLVRALLNPAVAASRLVVIQGESSTGKTRTAYEAVRAVLPDWRLDYPLDPAALDRRLDEEIPQQTVLWLGDLRQYADVDGGDKVIGRLGDLLDRPGRILITTIWPETARAYARAAKDSREAGEPTGRLASAATAGRLLQRVPDLAGADLHELDPAQGGRVTVPETFSQDDLVAAAASGDRVLAEAVAAAASAGRPGEVAQYLAGAFALIDQWQGQGGDRYMQAVITAAIDAARLGHAAPLQEALLLDAAVGYLSNVDRTEDARVWGPGALKSASAKLQGAVRALIPVAPAGRTGITGYRVADYLRQHGHAERIDQLGPVSLWDALAAHAASPADLTQLGYSAARRGLYLHASRLWTAAVGRSGSPAIAGELVSFLRQTGVANAGACARWVATVVSMDNPAALRDLVWSLDSRDEALGELAMRAATEVPVDDRMGVSLLLGALERRGQSEAAAELARRRPDSVPIAGALVQTAWRAEGTLLYERPPEASAGHVAVDLRELAHTPEERRALLAWVAEQVLLNSALAERPALDLSALAAATPNETADMLAFVSVDDPDWIRRAIIELVYLGLDEAAKVLSDRAAAETSLAEPKAIAWLLRELKLTDQEHALATLARRAAAETPLDDPAAVATLLMGLQAADCDQALAILLNRDPGRASQIDRANPDKWINGLSGLATILRELGNPAEDVERLGADAGAFQLLGWWDRYPFGREPDGSASPTWEWHAPDDPGAT